MIGVQREREREGERVRVRQLPSDISRPLPCVCLRVCVCVCVCVCVHMYMYDSGTQKRRPTLYAMYIICILPQAICTPQHVLQGERALSVLRYGILFQIQCF